ncbi:CheR family methyltransferase [Roseateles oligotrophus]|nr:CheR family methyltransferase [Roseateles oligotrophus]
MSPVVVGLGASAGGLAAFQAFFSAMPAEAKGADQIAFVLVQHLATEHKSLLPELIGRCTRMPVFEAADGMAVSGGCVYTCPPGHAIALLNGQLHLSEVGLPHGQSMPIDLFFRSLAQDQGERAIAVVLSGNGCDGSQGLHAVKACGGLVLAQTAASCEFDGMPSSAMATGLVDLATPPADMPAHLLDYVARLPSLEPTQVELGAQAGSAHSPALMTSLFVLLRARSGYDFSQYKPNTVLRRIERRMAVLQIDTLEQYLKHLQPNPTELDALFRDLLIGVTQFFRDEQAFRVLEQQVIPQLFEGRQAGDVIRVWSAACSTGEEAYSLAILLVEHMQTLAQDYTLQLFATDADSRAIATARAGIYPASIAADLSPERLKRFFTPEPDGNSYRVNKELRELLVFSEHDVTQDPPFSRLDLLSCRNLLIYLGADLQKKLIPLFHYALKPGGWLLLGSSEGVGEFDALFAAFDTKEKVYRAKEDLHGLQRRSLSRFLAPLSPLPIPLPSRALPSRPALQEFRARPRHPLRELTEQTLLRQVVPASILVNARGDMLYLHGRCGDFLEPSPGEVGVQNVFKMAREGLSAGLRLALHEAVATQKPVHAAKLSVSHKGKQSPVKLSIHPVAGAPNQALDTPLFLILLEDGPVETMAAGDPNLQPGEAAGHTFSGAALARINALTQELEAKEEYLQSTHDMLSNYAEDLQSTTEEMQSSNEELQSVNEELTTVNTELQSKVAGLSRANNDMNNLLGGSGIGTLFVDRQLRILRFTPAMRDIINLRDADLGRPITNLSTNLVGYNKLEADLQAVLKTLLPKLLLVQTEQGQWFTLRILPYRTVEEEVEGAVISLVNCTEMVEAQNALSRSSDMLERTGTMAKVGGWELDLTTTRITYSKETAKIHEVNLPYEPLLSQAPEYYPPEAWPRVLAAVSAAIEHGTDYDLESPFITAKGRHIWVRVQGSAVIENGKTVKLHGTIQDITARKQIESARQLADAQLEQAFGASPIGMALVALSGEFLRVNPAFCNMLGWSEPELLVTGFQSITHADDLAEDLRQVDDLIAGRSNAFQMEKRYVHKDGRLVWTQLNVSVVRDARGAPLHLVSQIQDISQRKRAEAAQQALLQEKTALLNEVHHRVKNNLQVITSLLRLETARNEHGGTKTVLREMQERIRAMALLHESIYRSGTFAALDLGAYLGQLATQLVRTLQTRTGAVQLRLELGSVQVGLDQATPCGLLLTELLSNCLKHGFPDGRSGEIYLALSPLAEPGRWRLQVSDTGVGLPTDFSKRQENSLGLQLVTDLSKQMGGVLAVGAGPAAIFTIEFTALLPAALNLKATTTGT